MGIFRSRAARTDGPSVRAAAGIGGLPGLLSTYVVGAASQRALSVPTVARAVGLITSSVGALDLRFYSRQWDPGTEKAEKIYIPAPTWSDRPDPDSTRQFFLASIVRDLMFHGRAFAWVQTRYATGYPASFKWIPASNITTPDQSGPEYFGPAEQIEFNGHRLRTDDVVQFLSPLGTGMLSYGNRAIEIAIALDTAAKRFSTTEIPAGWLQLKPGGESLDPASLAELAAQWAEARRSGQIGALNEYVEYKEASNASASALQLSEGRTHAAMEIARIAQVPPWLVGLAVGGMTYANSTETRKDLYLYGFRPYVDAIEQTLSGPNVLPRGQYLELDVLSYIQENDTMTAAVAVEQTVGAQP